MSQANGRLREVLQIYKHSSWWTRTHVSVRFKICPFLKLIKYIPQEGRILDLGCGHGLFLHLLWLAGFRDGRLIGVDLSQEKIEIAKRTAIGKNITFLAGDISRIDEERVDCVTVIDVFYLIRPDVRNEILDKCYRKLPKGGLLLIKDMDKRPRWKYYFCLLQETMAVKVLKITKAQELKFHYMQREEFMPTLRQKGFQVSAIPLDKGSPYPQVLYLCKKV